MGPPFPRRCHVGTTPSCTAHQSGSHTAAEPAPCRAPPSRGRQSPPRGLFLLPPRTALSARRCPFGLYQMRCWEASGFASWPQSPPTTRGTLDRRFHVQCQPAACTARPTQTRTARCAPILGASTTRQEWRFECPVPPPFPSSPSPQAPPAHFPSKHRLPGFGHCKPGSAVNTAQTLRPLQLGA